MNDLDRHLPSIVAGDADAFASWLASAEPPIRESLRRFSRSVDTEAVLQEALLRVWQVAPRFVADGKPNGLLRLGVRIARNLAISETRKLHGAVSSDAELDATPDPQPVSPPDPLLRRAIELCRERLPSKPAAALGARLASAGGEADADLAAALGMKTNTFLQNFTRARKLLLECLEARGVRLDVELT